MNNLLLAPKKMRLTNIESLRIVAMFFVLILHANNLSLGTYTTAEYHSAPIPTITRMLFEQTAICAVNLFVLISGWFGIRTKGESTVSLIFQYIFFSALLLIIPGCLSINSPSELLSPIKKLCGLNYFWFLSAYLMLLFLAPCLNAFIEKTDKRTLRLWIIVFYLFQTIWGWILGDAANQMFKAGYCGTSFIGLYLLARYVHLYHPLPFQQRAHVQYLAALSFILIPGIIEAFSAFFMGGVVSDIWRSRTLFYTAPHVVLCALFILTATARLRFTNLFVNRIAASAFAVYLFHLHPCVFPYFKQAAQWLYGHYSGAVFLLLTFGFLVAVFAAAVLIDQVRLLCWRSLARRFFTGRMKA